MIVKMLRQIESLLRKKIHFKTALAEVEPFERPPLYVYVMQKTNARKMR